MSEHKSLSGAKWISGILSTLFLATSLSAAPAQAQGITPHNGNPSRKAGTHEPQRLPPLHQHDAAIIDLAPQAGKTTRAPAAQQAAPDTTVQVGDREMRVITLENGLEISLTSDPKAFYSAASLAVGTGSLYDPADKPGLAHFLEHMLFLGTEKYPKVGQYQQFIEQNDGETNAYTADNVTNFFFGVRNEAFEGALDRFSDFFKHPLLDPAYAGREVNAVNSEFDKDKLDDGWRAKFLRNMASAPGHPLAHFDIGNRQTLAGDNQQALKAFFDKYYAASNMKLALVSDLSLDDQEALVRKYFAGIRDFHVDKPAVNPDFRPALQDKYRLLQIKGLEGGRTLNMEFPTIRLVDHRDSKPDDVISFILGHEGKGSLLSKLKEEGLALELSASGGYSDPNLNTMSIKVSLTQKGLQNYDRVMEIVFAYIDMVKQHGVSEYTFNEESAMSQTHFKWDAAPGSADYASSVAPLMFDYKPDELATLPYLIKKYDPAAYNAVLNSMTPQNMLVTLMGPNVSTDKTDPYFGAEYSLNEVGGDKFQRLSHPTAVAGIAYPAANPFVPQNLTLKDEAPHVLVNDKQAKIWSQFARGYNTPQAYMTLRLETPRAYDTPADLVKAMLWRSCLDKGMDEDIYPMQMAGLGYKAGISEKGVIVTLGGYTEHIGDLAALLAKNLTACKVTEQQFADVKDALTRGIESRSGAQAGEQIGYFYSQLTQKQIFSNEQILAALRDIKLRDVQSYARTFLGKTHIEGMAFGNWTDEEAKKTFEIVRRGVGGKSLPENEKILNESIPLRAGEKSVFSTQVSDNNNALLYVLQTGNPDSKRKAALEMVSKIVESDFYTEMRSRQQLGYIVQNEADADKKSLTLDFFIQSADYGPGELQKRVETWLKGAIGLFDQMSDEDFESFKAGIASSYQGAPSNMLAKEQNLFALAAEDGEFDRQQKMHDAVMALTKQDVIDFAHEILANPAAAQMSIQIRSANNNEPVPPGAFTTVQQFRNRPATLTLTPR